MGLPRLPNSLVATSTNVVRASSENSRKVTPQRSRNVNHGLQQLPRSRENLLEWMPMPYVLRSIPWRRESRAAPASAQRIFQTPRDSWQARPVRFSCLPPRAVAFECERAAHPRPLPTTTAWRQDIRNAGRAVLPGDPAARLHDFQRVPEAAAIAVVELAADARPEQRAGGGADDRCRRPGSPARRPSSRSRRPRRRRSLRRSAPGCSGR